MRRVILLLLLIPSLAFGAYTEFYAQSGGSNLNAGSTTNNTAAYTSASGNWVQSTGVFTVTDGTNPSLSVAVGDWASVYLNAATVGVCVGRVTAVSNATNGTITVAAGIIGAKPSNSTGGMKIKVGGAWQGPNAASGFPLTLANYGVNKDASAHASRLNMKNDQTYSLTSSVALTGSIGALRVVQGYSSSVGDGGKATWDGGTSTASLITSLGTTGYVFIDQIFKTSITSGTGQLVFAEFASTWVRCVFTGARWDGLVSSGSNTITVIESEAYNCGRNNTAGTSGFYLDTNTTGIYRRCISHDNAGSNVSGFISASTSGSAFYDQSISASNGQYGWSITGTTPNGPVSISNSDVYNNTSDGINIATGVPTLILFENVNLIKNGGKGVNNVSTTNFGYTYNIGYGAGTQANGASDTLNGIEQVGNVTYPNDVTPWVDPANGNFAINLAVAQGTGRGAFTITASSYGPTVGYPDLGAAQANIGVAFPTPTATATATPTPTATATATATPIETSYAFPQ